MVEEGSFSEARELKFRLSSLIVEDDRRKPSISSEASQCSECYSVVRMLKTYVDITTRIPKEKFREIAMTFLEEMDETGEMSHNASSNSEQSSESGQDVSASSSKTPNCSLNEQTSKSFLEDTVSLGDANDTITTLSEDCNHNQSSVENVEDSFAAAREDFRSESDIDEFKKSEDESISYENGGISALKEVGSTKGEILNDETENCLSPNGSETMDKQREDSSMILELSGSLEPKCVKFNNRNENPSADVAGKLVGTSQEGLENSEQKYISTSNSILSSKESKITFRNFSASSGNHTKKASEDFHISVENTWPRIDSFSDIETISMKEVKTCETPSLTIKYLRLELPNECIMIKISADIDNISVNAVKYKNSIALNNVENLGFLEESAESKVAGSQDLSEMIKPFETDTEKVTSPEESLPNSDAVKDKKQYEIDKISHEVDASNSSENSASDTKDKAVDITTSDEQESLETQVATSLFTALLNDSITEFPEILNFEATTEMLPEQLNESVGTTAVKKSTIEEGNECAEKHTTEKEENVSKDLTLLDKLRADSNLTLNDPLNEPLGTTEVKKSTIEEGNECAEEHKTEEEENVSEDSTLLDKPQTDSNLTLNDPEEKDCDIDNSVSGSCTDTFNESNTDSNQSGSLSKEKSDLLSDGNKISSMEEIIEQNDYKEMSLEAKMSPRTSKETYENFTDETLFTLSENVETTSQICSPKSADIKVSDNLISSECMENNSDATKNLGLEKNCNSPPNSIGIVSIESISSKPNKEKDALPETFEDSEIQEAKSSSWKLVIEDDENDSEECTETWKDLSKVIENDKLKKNEDSTEQSNVNKISISERFQKLLSDSDDSFKEIEEASENFVPHQADTISENDTIESDESTSVEGSTLESDGSRNQDDFTKSEKSKKRRNLRKLKRVNEDEVDSAPTRNRRGISKITEESIPEDSLVIKNDKNHHGFSENHRGSGRKISSYSRSLRSKSLDPAPSTSKFLTPDDDTPSNSAPDMRKKRAQTPDVKLKQEAKIGVRSSPRKLSKATSSASGESSNSGKTTRSREQTAVPLSTRRSKRGA